jgi:O-antigen ligase
MSRIVFWGLLALIVVVPWPLAADRPLPASIMALWVGLLLGLWAIFVARHRTHGRRVADRYLAPITLVFGAAMVWLVIQTAAPLPPALAPEAVQHAADLLQLPPPAGIGLDADAAWTTLMRLLAYAGVLFLAWEYGRDRDYADAIGRTILCATVACSAYGLLVQLAGLDQVLWFTKTSYRDSVTGPFINRNSFATYAGIGLSVALGMSVSRWSRQRARRSSRRAAEPGDWRLALALVAAGLLAVTLIMTRSRGGFYSFGIAVLAGGALLAIAGVLRGRTLAAAVGALVVAAVVLLAAGGAGLAGRLETDSASVESSRGALFAPTLAAIRSRPLLGYGLGSFTGVFEATNDGELYKAGYTVDKAHNTYLEMALEGGVPTAVALTLCVLALLSPCVLAVWRRRSLAFGLGATIATIGVGVHAAVDFSLQMPAVAVTFFALLGAFSGQSLRSLSEKPQSDR